MINVESENFMKYVVTCKSFIDWKPDALVSEHSFTGYGASKKARAKFLAIARGISGELVYKLQGDKKFDNILEKRTYRKGFNMVSLVIKKALLYN